MAGSFTPEVKRILLEHGCRFERRGKGDHEIWFSPITDRRLVVDGKIKSRHTANGVLRQAGIEKRFQAPSMTGSERDHEDPRAPRESGRGNRVGAITGRNEACSTTCRQERDGPNAASTASRPVAKRARTPVLSRKISPESSRSMEIAATIPKSRSVVPGGMPAPGHVIK